MNRDCFGNTLSASRPETAAAVDDFALGLLGYDKRIVNILDAADRDTDCLANVYAGLLWMLSETGAVPEDARRYLNRAQDATGAANDRERRAVSVLQCWIEDDLPRSIVRIEDILAAYPRDLVMLKLHQYHDFNSGDFPAMLRVALAGLAAAPDIGFVHGMAAFGYEQCHLLEKAETAARTALALGPDPWAQHALAHVMLTQGRTDEGARFLESMRDSWSGLTSFMVTHQWWHLALFYLSQGRNDEALAAYDDHCWSMSRDFSQDQIGAVSLLARFEFAGIDAGPRWNDLGRYLSARAGDVTNPFLSLQYLYGLARAGRPEAGHLLQAIRDAAALRDRPCDAVWREVALPIAEGLLAHANGDPESALRFLDAPFGRLAEIGGSHAQRDLFEQILLDCLLKTRRLPRAQQLLEMRRGFDPDGVALNRILAGVYDDLGLPTLAAEARARAALTMSRHRPSACRPPEAATAPR
ncbi:tetratricopeptide repeat protein [Lichenicola sp.]|uniref:tetratricopeptide repeat protein n=1 Tax=Lichenicola sp. TaxID=2804529 RepID=UPI003AFFF12A